MKNTDLLPTKKEYIKARIIMWVSTLLSLLIIAISIAYSVIAYKYGDNGAAIATLIILVVFGTLSNIILYIQHKPFLRYKIYVLKEQKLKKFLLKTFLYRKTIIEWDRLFLSDSVK